MNPLLACSFLAWLLAPVGLIAYHYGPGQDWQEEDGVAVIVADAEAAIADADVAVAIEKYREALDQMPAGHEADAWRLRLEICKAQIESQGLPDAHRELKVLLDEILESDSGKSEPNASKQREALLDETRHGLATSQFYMAYLMRLEGRDRADWEPELDNARQLLRLLAETATDESEAQSFSQDLEAVIRLQRADLADLQGQPIPKACSGCCSCDKPGKKKPGRKPCKSQKEKKDSRGAGLGTTSGVGS